MYYESMLCEVYGYWLAAKELGLKSYLVPRGSSRHSNTQGSCGKRWCRAAYCSTAVHSNSNAAPKANLSAPNALRAGYGGMK